MLSVGTTISRPQILPKFIIINAKSIIFNTKFIVFRILSWVDFTREPPQRDLAFVLCAKIDLIQSKQQPKNIRNTVEHQAKSHRFHECQRGVRRCARVCPG